MAEAALWLEITAPLTSLRGPDQWMHRPPGQYSSPNDMVVILARDSWEGSQTFRDPLWLSVSGRYQSSRFRR